MIPDPFLIRTFTVAVVAKVELALRKGEKPRFQEVFDEVVKEAELPGNAVPYITVMYAAEQALQEKGVL